jgi:hypothetical protein
MNANDHTVVASRAAHLSAPRGLSRSKEVPAGGMCEVYRARGADLAEMSLSRSVTTSEGYPPVHCP